MEQEILEKLLQSNIETQKMMQTVVTTVQGLQNNVIALNTTVGKLQEEVFETKKDIIEMKPKIGTLEKEILKKAQEIDGIQQDIIRLSKVFLKSTIEAKKDEK